MGKRKRNRGKGSKRGAYKREELEGSEGWLVGKWGKERERDKRERGNNRGGQREGVETNSSFSVKSLCFPSLQTS